MTISATLVVGQLIYSHLKNYKEEGSTALTIYILAMVPLYAWVSTLKLFLQDAEFTSTEKFECKFLDASKEVYEAVVLHDFLELMYVW
eukprot:CAMPEP_0172648100 /NCGR_PEP_ID=MMETSP1068-20121228/241096_1 /TAXON_ID=35684 /ORGANISM="Pseudopedinella elastica, Strain CCMP716" /LENGTH=87 /DNA_ID=CAMNT_0013462407 /DNA_START=171 /DNA_END=431 /DNA_ORIENTATION=-